MIRIVFTIVVILFTNTVYSQTNKPKYVWYTPNKIEKINGLAFGLDFYKDSSFHQVNGINLGFNLLSGVVMPINVLFGSLASPFSQKTSYTFPLLTNKHYHLDSTRTNFQLNGLNISLFSGLDISGHRSINGLSLTLAGCFGQKLNGFSLSGGANIFHDFNGILISIFQNKVYKGSGLQISLFNYCEDCHGVQIGLLNKMGKRTLPFINIRR